MAAQFILITFLLSCLTLSQPKSDINQQNNNHIVKTANYNQNTVCSQNCIACQTSSLVCDRCEIGFVLGTDYQCTKCPTGCLQCIGQQICTSCSPGYTTINYNYFIRCISCSNGCQTCQIIQTSSGQKIQKTSCTKCYQGYYQVIGTAMIAVCQPCISGCYSCASANDCIKCFSGFGYNSSSNECYICQQNCLVCSPNVGCQLCLASYFLQVIQGSLNVCQKCILNCFQCTNNFTCDLCTKGFYVYKQQNDNMNISICVSCPNQCELCHNQNVCLTCKQGYYLYVVEDSQSNSSTPVIQTASCLPCSQNCVFCNYQGICIACQQGHFINQYGACDLCGLACHQCISQTYCISCTGSYYLINNICQQCNKLCSTCTLAYLNNQPTQMCLNCVSMQYTLQNYNCIECSQVLTGCLTCTNPESCLSCSQGYYLRQNVCQPNKKLAVVYIIMICIAAIIGLVAIIFAIWACYRHKTALKGMQGFNNSSAIKSSYYQIP